LFPLAHPRPVSPGAVAAKMPQLVRIAHDGARMTSRSISNAAVCTGPSGASTMIPGQAVDGRKAHREVLAPPLTWVWARGVNQEPRHAIGAVDPAQATAAGHVRPVYIVDPIACCR
jgi:hypothetical protein